MVKDLLGYTNVLSPNEYEKNEKIVLKFFNKLKIKWIWGSHVGMFTYTDILIIDYFYQFNLKCLVFAKSLYKVYLINRRKKYFYEYEKEKMKPIRICCAKCRKFRQFTNSKVSISFR